MSENAKIQLLDVLLHLLAWGGKPEKHDCGKQGCVAPQIYEQYKRKYGMYRLHIAEDPIPRGTSVEVSTPSTCKLWSGFCQNHCPRKNDIESIKV